MIKVSKYDESYRSLLLGGMNDLKKEDLEKLENALSDIKPTEEYLICTDDLGNFVGFSKTTSRTRGIVLLDYIYVLPKLRRDKNGSVIMVAITTRAVNTLNVAVVAECPKDNQCALEFFKARNFLITSEEENSLCLSRSLLPMYK